MKSACLTILLLVPLTFTAPATAQGVQFEVLPESAQSVPLTKELERLKEVLPAEDVYPVLIHNVTPGQAIIQIRTRDDQIIQLHRTYSSPVPGFTGWHRWIGLSADNRAGGLILFTEKGDLTGMFFQDAGLFPLGAELKSKLVNDSRQARALYKIDHQRLKIREGTGEETLIPYKPSQSDFQCWEDWCQERDGLDEVPPLLQDNGTIHRIRVLVAYTTAARDQIEEQWLVSPAEDKQSLHRLLSQETTNWSFRLSNLPIEIETVPNVFITPDLSKTYGGKNSWQAVASGTPPFTCLSDARVQAEADVLALVVGSSSMVDSGLVCDLPGESPEEAVLLVKWESSVEGLMFAHELGHVLGAGHHEPPFSRYWRSYARGWCGPIWSTVMRGSYCSSPLPFWSGAQPDAAGHAKLNNAAAIRERAPKVACYGEELAGIECQFSPSARTITLSQNE